MGWVGRLVGGWVGGSVDRAVAEPVGRSVGQSVGRPAVGQGARHKAQEALLFLEEAPLSTRKANPPTITPPRLNDAKSGNSDAEMRLKRGTLDAIMMLTTCRYEAKFSQTCCQFDATMIQI